MMNLGLFSTNLTYLIMLIYGIAKNILIAENSLSNDAEYFLFSYIIIIFNT